VGLALFLTFFIMTPVWQTIHEKALVPYQEKKISQGKALEEALKPVRKFMFKQTREKDLALFIQLAKMPRPKNQDEIPTTVLLPSFMISELKTAFQIGCLLYIPFLIVDMVVSSVLLSMGMMMLPGDDLAAVQGFAVRPGGRLEPAGGIDGEEFLLKRQRAESKRGKRRGFMNPDLVGQIARDAIEITLYLALPILGVGLVAGLLVSLFQAVTQIQEATLVFVPKLVAVLLALLFLSPWMMRKMLTYTEQMIVNLPQYVK